MTYVNIFCIHLKNICNNENSLSLKFRKNKNRLMNCWFYSFLIHYFSIFFFLFFTNIFLIFFLFYFFHLVWCSNLFFSSPQFFFPFPVLFLLLFLHSFPFSIPSHCLPTNLLIILHYWLCPSKITCHTPATCNILCNQNFQSFPLPHHQTLQKQNAFLHWHVALVSWGS